MLRRAIQLCLPLLLCVALAPAQEPQQKAEAKPADYSKEPFVIEQIKTVQRFENDGTGTRRVHARIHVQNEGGVQALGQLALGYNSANERLTVDSVRVRKADGTVVTAGPDAVQDLSAPIEREAPVYTDYRQKHITVPGLRPGETLEYEITTEIVTPLAAGHFWLDFNFTRQVIVLDEQLEVSFPTGRSVKIKTLPRNEDDPPLTVEETVEQGRQIHRWKSSNPARPGDDEDEELGEKTDRPKKKRKKKESSDVQVTTFQSWEEIGRWYGQLQQERIAPSDAIRSKARDLTSALGTNLEKVEGLYSYVARNFRYVSLSFGVGRYQPHNAADVLTNQYGDCKDKHTLLSSLLEAADLHAWPVLINSRRKLDEEIPSPSQFDHVITAVPLGDDLLWMDTTTEIAPFRLLNAALRGKKALVIPTDGTPPRLIETPPDPPFASTQHVEIEGSISELGKLDAMVRYVVRGDNELPLRMAFRRTPQGRWKELGQMVAYSDGLIGQVTDVKPSDPADTSGPFHLEYRVSIPNFLDWSSKQSQLRIPLPKIGMPRADADLEPEDDPVELGSPVDVHTTLKLTLPPNYSARAPIPVGLKRDYAEYRSQYKVEGQTITAQRNMRFLLREVPAARARDYTSFSRAVDSDTAQTVALTSTLAGKPTVPESAKTEELHEAGLRAMRSGDLRLAVELLRRVVEKDPKHKWGWNNLGLAYLSLREFDAAVPAFQKQIEINPYDEYAHNNLGRAYREQRNYDEAEKAFQKQIEVQPLDKWAHANLGRMYRELKRYDEALASLERAVVITPQDPAVHISLGQVYLKKDRGEDALAAFDKAVEISPTTTTFNNVAYELSLANTHLDRAQQYAESAVASTAAQLRNLSLARLTRDDLANVSGMAAYWDTLGWVHFQRGDLDKAEKYIEASWLLDFHGEVGDHLAQIHEKRGDKEKAAQLYAQALAATRPQPETRSRLMALLDHDEKKVLTAVQKGAEENSQLRTVKLGPWKEDLTSAEFFVLLAPGPDVEEIRFVSGDEKLRPFADTLRKASFPALFPGETVTKLVRRGVLSCSKISGCNFVLMTPDTVTSLN